MFGANRMDFLCSQIAVGQELEVYIGKASVLDRLYVRTSDRKYLSVRVKPWHFFPD